MPGFRKTAWKAASWSDKDQRHYLMQEIERAGVMDPKPNHNWRFVPESWVRPAAERDRRLLFDR